ncbi:hypothetical protein Bca101_026672 [Brassica carinata]
MKSDTAAHILSQIKSSDAGEVLSSISEHLGPILDLLTCREDERARANRSITKRFLPFIKKSVSLLHERLSLITSPESSPPGDLFRAYDFCLECYEMVSRHPTAVQARRLALIHSYQRWGWYTHAYNDGFRVLEQLDEPESYSRAFLFLPLAKPGCGQGSLARVLLKVVASIVSSVAMSRDMEENQYLRVCSLLCEIKPWLRYLDGNAPEKFLKLILSDMEKCALSIVRESVRFDEGFVHSFCISTLNEYSVSSLPKCHLYKFSRQVLSLVSLSKEIKTEAVACELKVEDEANWLDLLALVSYYAHKCMLAGDRVSKQLNNIAAVFLEAIPQANVVLRLYSAGVSVNEFKETLGLEGLLGDDNLWKSIVSLLGMIDHYPDDKTTLSDVKKINTQVQTNVNCYHKGAMEYTIPYVDALRRWTYDKTLLNVAMAAFLISMRTQRKLEITAHLVEDVIASPWISTSDLKYLFASFHDISVAFYSSKHLKKASMAFKLCIRTVWTCVGLLSQIHVNESSPYEDCLSREAIIDFASEACSKSEFYLDVLQQHGAQEIQKLLVFILEKWSTAEGLIKKLPDLTPIIKQWVKIQSRHHETQGLAGSSTPLYSLLSFSQKISKTVTRKLLEQELLAYEEILPMSSELCREKHIKIADILLKEVFITKDLLVERARTLIWRARVIRASGTEHLKECIHYLSEAIFISGNFLNEQNNHEPLCCHQLAVAHCLRALCIQETEPDSKKVFQDVNKSLNIWLRIKTPSHSKDSIPLENVIPLLCNVVDLLSIKGWIELQHHIYELIFRLFKWKNVKLEACVAMLWDCRRLSHALCPCPINDAVILSLSEYFGEKSESTDFWMSCLRFSKAKSIGFHLSLQSSPYETLHKLDKREDPHRADITIVDINNTASELVSSDPIPSHSSFVAASLYYDLCEKQLSCGNFHEALSYAKEAHRIRHLIFRDKFSYVEEKHIQKHNMAGKIIEITTYVINKFEVSNLKAADVWPCGKFVWDINSFYLGPWNVLQCYLESILQVGFINELIGEGVEAERFLSRGKAISCMQRLQPFVVAFSLALGNLYKRMQSFDIAAKELQSVKELLYDSGRDFSCRNCRLTVEVTLDMLLGDLSQRGYDNNTATPCQIYGLSHAESLFSTALRKLCCSAWKGCNNCTVNKKPTDNRDSKRKRRGVINFQACVTKEQNNLISEPSMRLTRSMSRSLKERGHVTYVDMHISKKRSFSDESDLVDIFDAKDTVCSICSCINKKCHQCLSNNEATRPGVVKSLISSKWQFQQRRLVCSVLSRLGMLFLPGGRDACTMQFLTGAAPVGYGFGTVI